MTNRFSLLALAVLLALGAGYLTLGPSVFVGGPSKSSIVQATRSAMIAAAASPEEDAAAQAAQITPQGLCSRNADGSHACLVEVTTPGTAPRSLISVLRKDAGGWIPVQ
jgi:hypothetical protein